MTGMTSSCSAGPSGYRIGTIVLAVCLAGCSRSCGSDDAAALARGPFPRHTLANTEVRVLPRTAAGRAYQLYVALPDSFEAEPEQRYPVLYLCDGYWDFALVSTIVQDLRIDHAMPEVLVVGLGYAGDNPNYGRLRRWDLTPVAATYEGASYDGPSGHAQAFLATIENDIIPLVEREYRGDPGYRVLVGSSLGGLFTLYAMFARPALFAGYVAASPAAQWADDWLLGFEAEFHKSAQPLGVRLFVTAAEKDPAMILDGAKRFDARMRASVYPGIAYQFRLIDGEGHSATKPESYTRGIAFAFSPRAPNPSYE
jgi:predicted alpha/beta superfamily hydrolase